LKQGQSRFANDRKKGKGTERIAALFDKEGVMIRCSYSWKSWTRYDNTTRTPSEVTERNTNPIQIKLISTWSQQDLTI